MIIENHNPWQRIDSTEVYKNPWIKVTHQNVINPSGGKGIYGVVEFQNYAVGILPIDKDGYIWLVGQYRYPINCYSWEIPEGGCPLNTDPLDSAKRELLEEIGLKANNWELMQTMYLSNSVSTEIAYIYIATDLTMHQAEPEETEQLVIKKLHFNEVYKMVLDGTITDSITITAILKAKILLFT